MSEKTRTSISPALRGQADGNNPALSSTVHNRKSQQGKVPNVKPPVISRHCGDNQKVNHYNFLLSYFSLTRAAAHNPCERVMQDTGYIEREKVIALHLSLAIPHRWGGAWIQMTSALMVL